VTHTPTRHIQLNTPAGPERVVLRVTDLDAILELRHAILRAALPLDTAHFDGDDDRNTVHIGAFTEDDDNIGCASFMLNSWEGAPAWQLRGMATRDDLRGIGLGREMLSFAVDVLQDAAPHIKRLWCNARTPAAPFYERLGWSIVSDEFIVPTAGPHFRMTTRLQEVT